MIPKIFQAIHLRHYFKKRTEAVGEWSERKKSGHVLLFISSIEEFSMLSNKSKQFDLRVKINYLYKAIVKRVRLTTSKSIKFIANFIHFSACCSPATLQQLSYPTHLMSLKELQQLTFNNLTFEISLETRSLSVSLRMAV